MRDIDEMFKDILGKKEQEINLFDNDNSWLVSLLILMLISMPNNNDQPIINIFLGDE